MTVEIIQGDCVKAIRDRFQDRSFRPNLIFADPPFNIGYDYDVYEDKKSRDEYLRWTTEWMSCCSIVMDPGSSIWIAIGDEYVHRLRTIAEDVFEWNFVAHCCWHFSFGQHRSRGFTRAHTHLLHYSKTKDYTWNGDAIKVPSWRLLNGDKRANPSGRHPDDVWSFPRICGTHKERLGWHGCQMPEAILARIIRVSSNPGDLVFDPCLGSGTSGAVAKKLGRNFIGAELSEDYAAKAKERIDGVSIGDPIQGEKAQGVCIP